MAAILQLNCRGSWAAWDDLGKHLTESEFSVVAVQEPPVVGDGGLIEPALPDLEGTIHSAAESFSGYLDGLLQAGRGADGVRRGGRAVNAARAVILRTASQGGSSRQGFRGNSPSEPTNSCSGEDAGWWTPELEDARRKVRRARAEMTRRSTEAVAKQYKVRNQYVRMLRRSRREHWRRMASEEVLTNVWGRAYRWVRNRLTRRVSARWGPGRAHDRAGSSRSAGSIPAL